MATVKRSEVRAALKARMGQFLLNRPFLMRRIDRTASLKSLPLPALLGDVATERMLDELMDELHKKLGTNENLVILDG